MYTLGGYTSTARKSLLITITIRNIIMNYRKTAARRNRKWRWPTGNSKDKWANSYVALKHNANAKEYYFDLYEYFCKFD